MRWFVAAVGLGTVLLVAAIVSGWGPRAERDETAQRPDLLRVLHGPRDRAPGCVRDRDPPLPLYELDLVVKKTVLYAVVALVLIAIFFVFAVLVGQAFIEANPFAILGSIAIGLLFWPVVRLARRIADRVVYGGARRRTRSSPSSRDASPGPTPPRMCCRGWRGSWSTRWAHARRWSGSTWAPSSGRRGSRPRKSTRRPRSALEAKDSAAPGRRRLGRGPRPGRAPRGAVRLDVLERSDESGQGAADG